MAKIVTDFAYGEYHNSDFDIMVYNINSQMVLIIEDDVDRIEIELSKNQFNRLFKTIKEEIGNGE